MDSDDDGSVLMDSFRSRRRKAPTPAASRLRTKAPSFSPADFISGESSADDLNMNSLVAKAFPRPRRAVAVKVAPVQNRSQYTFYKAEDTVGSILQEKDKKGNLTYEVKLTDGRTKTISFEELLTIDGGSQALENFQHDPNQSDGNSYSEAEPRMQRRSAPRQSMRREGYLDISAFDLSSGEDELALKPKKSRQGRLRASTRASESRSRTSRGRSSLALTLSSDEDSDDIGPLRRRKKRQARLVEPTRRSVRNTSAAKDYNEDDEDGDTNSEASSGSDILRSDILGGRRKRKRGRPAQAKPEKIPRAGVRQSDRTTRARNNMEEVNIDADIYRSESEPNKQPAGPKITGTREVFQVLPRSNLFRSRHIEGCETCGGGTNISALVYCQGCCLAYHKNCIGNRSTREHLVTKIGDEEFVLQCRRCINIPRKKDLSAPDLSMCQDCHCPGAACRPFSKRKTTIQQQKERDENNGVDPIVHVAEDLINNAHNVLFRCTGCSRCYHYHHLPPLSAYSMDIARDEEETADERFQEYSKRWLCKECEDHKKDKVNTIIAWRPTDLEAYRLGTSCEMVSEDDKAYLIKWEGQSYFRASWHSGAWTWGVTAAAMRKAFYKREDGPKMRTEDAIPEEFLRIDIVLDVKYTSYVEVRTEEIDRARIKEVDKALIKYKGLGYEDAVWETVPVPEDEDRWLDFVTAYNDWVAGRYLKAPKQGPLKARLEKARGTPFSKLEKEKQPDNLVGGELMKYQIDGLNWLYYQWYSQKNGILADEMGLGKTIQVIGWIATLVHDHNCFPFIVVVPNSTCANWRREIKQWVPSLRVVTYFGSAQARDMAYRYELYPNGTKELKAHVVVTSYEAAADDSSRKFLKGVSWAGLVVDEGQRLKNDKSQLYAALDAVKSPFRLLLTGTPLQNNARELFNLLQFLDDTIKAADLEEQYAEMTNENIRELHDQIRPFILRRTKAQVLTFLPPLGQIIVPLSMSHLQKNLYKSILARNPELLKTLFTSTNTLKQQERANLSNILMQLRKCLCHPFVYSQDIEERTDIASVSHRNLVEASAKLQLLELLLPKLHERGHRVLIFSQFLDQLNIMEDFLDGMQLAYQRLDGTMGSLEKQKRIDQFNAPESPLFAFLLSTRAGGVGINLATADTVIILDPDFNPHQDIQAISRAHRIGQKKKVLCFQLMTRASAEEKIMQIGRKKMALDHVVVEQMDAEDIEEKDVASILKYGAAELFKDNSGANDIRYDDASIEKLLDRSQIENTKTNEDNSAESQFSFARVWANDQGALKESLDAPEEEVAPDPGVWDKILKERQAAAAAEAIRRADALGKGRRARGVVNYNAEDPDFPPDGPDAEGNLSMPEPSPVKPGKKKKRQKENINSDSDTDFQAEESSEEEDVLEGESDANDIARPEVFKPHGIVAAQTEKNRTGDTHGQVAFNQKASTAPGLPQLSARQHAEAVLAPTGSKINAPKASHAALANSAVKPFVRATLPIRSPLGATFDQHNLPVCIACQQQHPRGACPLKVAGAEHCGLCGLAHYGQGRTCPHIKSETQVRDMLEALRNSPEKKELVELALKYLRGVKGTLVQQKKKDREKQEAQRLAAAGGGMSTAHQLHGLSARGIFVGAGAPHIPGSVGSTLAGMQGMHRAPVPLPDQTAAQAQAQAQVQAQTPDVGIDYGNGDGQLDDHAVESALRGFLGR